MYDLNNLKTTFNNIKNLRESVYNLLNALKEKVDILNDIYKNLLIDNMKETKNGLDSLHFQSKLINFEIENNNNIFNMIDNHMYCNYYKLYKSVLKYLQENIKNTNITSAFSTKEYPVYKDLDIKTQYDFNMSIEIYNTIIQILDILNNEFLTREHKLSLENNRKKSGLNIDNLINSLQYNNNYMKNNIQLFNDYLMIYNEFHNKYLTRFSLRTKLLYGQINNDIKLEESKSNINYSMSDENIILELEEETSMRDFINSCSNTKDNVILQKKELDNIISGINISPQNSDSSNTSTPNKKNEQKQIFCDFSNNDMKKFIEKIKNYKNKKDNLYEKINLIKDLSLNNNIIDNNNKNENKKKKKNNLKNDNFKDNDIEYNLNTCIIV